MKRIMAGLAVLALLGLVPVGLAEDKKPEKLNVPPEGFTALFNGKDLTGWQAAIPINQRNKLSPEERAKKQKEVNDDVLPHWTVQDGAIYHDGKRGKYGYNLTPTKDFGNFELYVDWKIEEKGDSGLYLRGQPQVQIWDSDNAPGAKGIDKGSGSGGLWNNPMPKLDDKSKELEVARKIGKMPLKKADKPVGEWNTFHILMKGDKVTVFLNGEKVLNEAPLANFFEKGKPLPARGPIELQHHGDKLWFRNIFIKELPD